MLDIHRRFGLYDERDQAQDQEETGSDVLVAHRIGAFEVRASTPECGSSRVEGWAGAAILIAVVESATVFFPTANAAA